jgi:hypothetical protein
MIARRLSRCTGLALLALAISGCSRTPPAVTEAPTPSRSTSSTVAAAPAHAAGYHGKTDCQWVVGWAWDNGHPDAALNVDIYDGSVLLSTVAADQFRQDLKEAGMGTGKYGFTFRVPASLRDGKPHSIRVRFHGTNTDLRDTPKTITCQP